MSCQIATAAAEGVNKSVLKSVLNMYRVSGLSVNDFQHLLRTQTEVDFAEILFAYSYSPNLDKHKISLNLVTKHTFYATLPIYRKPVRIGSFLPEILA